MNRMRTLKQVQDSAVQAIRYYGNVRAALKGSDRFTGDVVSQLELMIIREPSDLISVPVAARLRLSGTRERFIMTSLGIVVNLETGDIINPHNLPYPLEIYRYGRR